ncbi:MAG: DUF2141 domain-containing protein [Gammaproteobacteria bacterium]|nr:DUF2141 domain-containing protein [Gammaproteobacteria bacterium]
MSLKPGISSFVGCFLAFSFLLSHSASATDQSERGMLSVKVKGLRSSNGTVRVSLYNSEESYSNHLKPFKAAVLAITDQQCEWQLQDLEPGDYAIKLFHDVNGNAELDSSVFGVPKEPYGFSNNARGRFGPPSYEAVKFKVGTATAVQEILAE